MLALVIAGICGVAAYRMMGSRIAAQKPLPTAKVVAAANDLKIGTVLTAQDVTTTHVTGSAPKGAILDPKNAIGRGVIAAIYQGEPIMDSRLAPQGTGGGMAATIPQGMRACAVRVDEVVGVAGFVTPGMRVDVMVSGMPPVPEPGQQGTITKTVLQNIAVLSAGTDIQKDAEGKPVQVQVVNLLVTPEQAQMLSLASNQLKIQLVLRNPLDTKVADVPSTAMNNLFAGGGPAPVARRGTGRRVAKAPGAEPYSIIVTNGLNTTTQKFPNPGGQH